MAATILVTAAVVVLVMCLLCRQVRHLGGGAYLDARFLTMLG
jgi:hypothetical protein